MDAPQVVVLGEGPLLAGPATPRIEFPEFRSMPGFRRLSRLLPLATLALAVARPAPVAAAAAGADGSAPTISFPVLGPVEYTDGWGNCRDGCSRRHKGTDILGVRLQPLLAATDGTLTRVRHEP